MVFIENKAINQYDNHMEKIEIKVLNNVKEDAKKNYQLFKWVLVEEKTDLRETTLVFERDNEVSYYPELVKLENKFNKVYSIPGWIGYALIGLILVYVTIIAILWITHIVDLEKQYFVIILAIPTGVLLLLNVLFTFLRGREMNYHLTKKDEKYAKYQKLVDELVK